MYEELKGKRLLLLGGNAELIDIKRFAESSQVSLIAAGYCPDADYCKAADEYYNINTTDTTEMKAFIMEHHIDGVYMGGNEQVIGAATKYLAELGYPCYCTCEQWIKIQNKGNFKDLCQKAGLPVAKSYIGMQDVMDYDFPVITKPIDGSGSDGFSVCNNREELSKGYSKAVKASFSGNVLIEQYLPNKSVVVIYTFSKGKMFFSGMENKIPVHYEKQGSFVKGIAWMDSFFADEFRRLYEKKLEKLFASIGIREGSIWIEVFHEGSKYYFNEAGYRYSGSFTPYPVDYLHGINQIYSDLLFSLSGNSKPFGNPSLIPSKIVRGKHYCLLPIHMRSGLISSIEGIDRVENFKECVKIVQKKKLGVFVEDSGSFDQVFCIIHFVFSTETELKDTVKRIYEVLRVCDRNGNNLIRNMLDIDSIVSQISRY